MYAKLRSKQCKLQLDADRIQVDAGRIGSGCIKGWCDRRQLHMSWMRTYPRWIRAHRVSSSYSPEGVCVVH